MLVFQLPTDKRERNTNMSKELKWAIPLVVVALLILVMSKLACDNIINQFADDEIPVTINPRDPKPPTADCRGWALSSTTGCCCSPEGLWLNYQGRPVIVATCTQSETDKMLCPSAFPRPSELAHHRYCAWHGNERSCYDDVLMEEHRKQGL
jgi:hypothetical protein